MNISQFLNPIYLPSVDGNLHIADTTLPTSPPPLGSGPLIINPYNSHVDGFVTKTLFGGITGKNMGKLVLSDPPPADDTETIKAKFQSVSNLTLLQQTGRNMGVGAAIYGGLSILKQGFGLVSGKQDAGGAAANITTDILRGGAAGLGASAAGSLTGLAMRALGATGTIGTVVTFVGGMVGATIGSGLIEATGVRNALIQSFGSKKALLPA